MVFEQDEIPSRYALNVRICIKLFRVVGLEGKGYWKASSILRLIAVRFHFIGPLARKDLSDTVRQRFEQHIYHCMEVDSQCCQVNLHDGISLDTHCCELTLKKCQIETNVTLLSFSRFHGKLQKVVITNN